MTRRGFVMPIVMLLSIVIGLLSGIMLSRAGQRSVIVREQLTGYTASHRDRGIKEMAAAWLKYTADQNLTEMTGGGPSGGEAFTMRIGRNETITVRFEPAQARARINPIGLNVADARAARQTETILRERFGEQGLSMRTREVGPAALDTMLAADEVVAAVAESVLGDPALAGRFVSELRQQDATDVIDAPTVRLAAQNVGIDDERTDRLAMLFGVEPTLWRVRARWVSRDPLQRSPDRVEVYEGLVNLSGNAEIGFGTQHPSELFLEWGRIEEAEGYTGP